MEQIHKQQDHQALLKAKYCPRVAVAACTQKKRQKTMPPWPLTYDLEIQQGLEVVEVHVRATCKNCIKLNAAVHELSWSQTWFALSRNGKNLRIGSYDLDL